MKKMRNENGELTLQALKCGFIFNLYDETGERGLKLWMEHNALHVRCHNYAEHKRIFWNVYNSNQLLIAKQCFYNAAKEYFNMDKKSAIRKGCYI